MFDAEAAALGCAIVSTSVVPRLLNDFREEDFYVPAHRRIYRAIRILFDQKLDVDVLSVGDIIRKFGREDEIGGLGYLHSVANGDQNRDFFDTYAKTVRDMAGLRQIIHKCRETEDRAHVLGTDPEELRQEMVSSLLGLKRGNRQGPIRLDEAVGAEVERVCEGRAIPVMDFGIPSLDRFCGGLEPKDLGIIGGLPGCGKTAFLHQFAMHAAKKWGKGLIFSLEISTEAVARRNLARQSGFSYRELRDAQRWIDGNRWSFNEEDRDILRAAQEMAAESMQNLWIDSGSYELDGIVTTAHELHAREELKFVAIDYAQLVEIRNASKRNVEVEAVTRAAKNRLAVDLNIPVVMISSLSKEGQKRSTLNLADLAESAALEYTASLIMFLTEDKTFESNGQGEGIFGVTADVQKCRNDRKGKVSLLFHASRFLLTGRDDHHHGGDAPPEGEHWDN